jgi:hypothetical protein
LRTNSSPRSCCKARDGTAVPALPTSPRVEATPPLPATNGLSPQRAATALQGASATRSGADPTLWPIVAAAARVSFACLHEAWRSAALRLRPVVPIPIPSAAASIALPSGWLDMRRFRRRVDAAIDRLVPSRRTVRPHMAGGGV